MTKLIYTGPPNQKNLDVGEATGDAVLKPGKVYDLPAELAERILDSNAHWAPAAEKNRAPLPADDGKED